MKTWTAPFAAAACAVGLVVTAGSAGAATDDGLRWQPLAGGRLPATPGEVAIRADADLPAVFHASQRGQRHRRKNRQIDKQDLGGFTDAKPDHHQR